MIVSPTLSWNASWTSAASRRPPAEPMARRGLTGAGRAYPYRTTLNGGPMPRTPQELNAEQAVALDAARAAQRQFERAQREYETASDDRAAAFTAALEAGITYGELGAAFGWS